MATLLGLLTFTGTGVAPAASAKKKKRRRTKAKVEGPCGNGGGKANRCKRNRQCCTGYCKTRKSRRRKNGKRRKVEGRCRCRKAGQRCTDDTNCCPERTGRICLDAICRIPTCTDLCPDGCCAGETCLAGERDDACGTGGERCASCGTMQFCAEGACRLCLRGVCEPGNTSGCQYATLQEAIDAPDGPATLHLCAGTYQERITITRDLTIRGAGQGEDGTILDGQQAGPVVTVQRSPTVTLQALRITGGQGTDGGGVRNACNDCALTLTDCTITGNVATSTHPAEGNGGGLFHACNGCPLTLDRCTVSANTASNGGGLYNNFNDTLTLTDCTVTGNTATEGHGGGIDTREGGTVQLTNTEVTGNEASAEGGGINNHQGGTVKLTGTSSVSGNTNGNCDGPGTYNDPDDACAP